MFGSCVIPKHHKQKTPDAKTGGNTSFLRQTQRGVENILRWCKSSSAEQLTIYTRHTAMTQVFHQSRKKSHKEPLYLTTRQNICKPKTMSKQKFAFQLCFTHVLFPKITSIKRQMQRPEITGHSHVNCKEEWNMFYDGVNNRVQSNRQFTQDLRQWHKSSIEAEKNISQGSIGL